MTDALQVTAYCYVAMALCVLIAEFSPRRKPAAAGAVAGIVCALIGGASWCYAALYSNSEWPDFGYRTAQSDKPAVIRHHTADDEGEDDANDEDSNDAPSGGKTAVARAEGESRGGQVSLLETAGFKFKRRILAGLRLWHTADAECEADALLVKDCDDCPELIRIAAGSTVIGAGGNDRLADAAERPAGPRRFWPGFMIGREAVRAKSFARFLDATQRPHPVCPQDGPVKDAAPAPARFARCVSAADADAYVSWLTARTGKNYRLASANEWEYAAKTATTPVAALDDVPAAYNLRLGDVREIVADCWRPYIPSPGNEVIAATAGRFLCDERMLKGWSEHDTDNWRRVSARRQLERDARSFETGLRVVRSFD